MYSMHHHTHTHTSPRMLCACQYSRNNTVLSKRHRMDGSLQLNKQTNKQRIKQPDKTQCISFQSILIYGVGFKHHKCKTSSLTLIWHNQRELLYHGCQQLHHGFYVLSAEKGITSVKCPTRKYLLKWLPGRQSVLKTLH